MQPAVAMNLHDPAGIMFPHLKAITSDLQALFERVFLTVTAVTQQNSPEHISWLQSDSFFDVTYHAHEVSVGDDFLTLYSHAAAACHPEQVIHLCFIDRVAFALQTEHRVAFMADVQSLTPEDTPLIFQRSAAAWETHPRNYRDLEQMITTVGEWLFGKSLDFAWCHLALQTHQLQQALSHITRRDLAMLSEFVLALRYSFETKEVNWLTWEDPFILSCDPQQLKAEREQSVSETRKRLTYVIPMLQLLYATAERDKMINSASTVALAVLYHDPPGTLYDQIERVLPVLNDTFAGIAVQASHGANARSLALFAAANALVEQRSSVEESAGPKYGKFRRQALALALKFDAPFLMYCDGDRVLHWADRYPNELPRLVACLPENDFTIIGRTPRAFETHPGYQRDTEGIINRVYAAISGFPWDVTAAARGLSRQAAAAILAGCPDDDITNDVSWPLFLQSATDLTLGYTAVEGLEFETGDRFAEEIAAAGSYDKWLKQIDADPRR